MIPLKTEPLAATDSARRAARMLVVDGVGGTLASRALAQLAEVLLPGDVLAVNDAATLPASLSGYAADGTAPVELRLLAPVAASTVTWQVVAFGAGDWRTPTERRALPPPLVVGSVLVFGGGLRARLVAVSPDFSRRLTVTFLVPPDQWLSALYRAGRPVQYAYHKRGLELWEQQTMFAVYPVALEPPSASMNMTWRSVLALRAGGVEVVALTHATGLSSTGDAGLDAQLPLPEHYKIPAATAAAVNGALRHGRRVVALGTGAMRALESAALGGAVEAGPGIAAVHIEPDFKRAVVSGLLTGMHDPGSSHMRLLGSFGVDQLLERAYARALDDGYLWHEYGDTCLILV